MKTNTEFKIRLICLGISIFVMIFWLATLALGLVRG